MSNQSLFKDDASKIVQRHLERYIRSAKGCYVIVFPPLNYHTSQIKAANGCDNYFHNNKAKISTEKFLISLFDHFMRLSTERFDAHTCGQASFMLF